jgi:hypothetical protein
MNIVCVCVRVCGCVDFVRVAAAKMLQDVKNTGPTRDLFTYFVYKLLGGKVDNHSITSVHNITQFVFAGTPVMVFRHFYQLIKSGKFCVCITPKPPDC